jgi:hypothetical protein
LESPPLISIPSIEDSESVIRNGNEVVIWWHACGSFPHKHHPVAAAFESKIRALKRLTHGPARELRIEVTDAVKTDQTRKNPMPPDFVSAAHARGVEVGGVPTVTDHDRTATTSYCQIPRS